MDIIEMTRQLGVAIQDSEIYKLYATCRENNDKDEELQKLIGEFNLLRMSLSNELSKEEDKKDKEKIQSLNGDLNTCYETIMKNENMMKFNAAKEGIDALVNKITMIIGLAVEGEDPLTCETESSCTGSCSTCGGCH